MANRLAGWRPWIPSRLMGAYVSSTESGKGLGEQMATVSKWKWLILLCIVLGGTIAAWRASGRAAYFVGVATITMTDEREKYFYSPTQLADPTLEYFQAYIYQRGKTITEVMNSLAVRQAVARYMAASRSGAPENNRQSKGLGGPPGNRPINPMAVPPASVHMGQRNPLITITTTSLQRDLALHSLEGYLSVFKDYYQEKKQGDARKALAWLTDKVAKAREDLSRSREALQAFKKKHGVTTEDVDSAVSNRLTDGWLDRLGLDDQKPLDDESTNPSLLTLQDPTLRQAADPHMVTLQRRLAELESKYGDMAQVYAPTYPTMIVLRKKIKLLKTMLGDLDQRQTDALAATAHESRKRERRARDDAWDEIARLNAAGPEFRLLKMELETNEKLYEVLISEYKKAERRVSAVTEDFTVASSPTVVKIQPTYGKKVAMGGMLGLFVGVRDLR